MKEDVTKLITYALEQEQDWDKILSKTDSGSYCESAGHDYVLILPVYKAYQELVNALINYQRG